MKKFFLLFLFLKFGFGYAQVTIDTTVKLDLLKAPSSPAFTILGIATSDIERPTDLNSFTLSLQQATNNLSAIPKSYAIQVAPFLLSNKKYTLNEFDDNTHAFKQSFLLSAGFTHQGPQGNEDVDSLKTSKLGFGVKFSFIRPEWSTDTRDRYHALVEAQRALLNDYRAEEAKNIELPQRREELRELALKPNKTAEEQIKMRVLVSYIQELTERLGDSTNERLQQSSASFGFVQKAANDMKNERKGFFLDFASGFALNFPDNRFNNSKVYRGGAWLTGGIENGNAGITSMFIVRYLFNPESAFADPDNVLNNENLSTLDAGGRLLLSSGKGKFALSAEALYRSILGSASVDASWRLVLNTEYDIGMNRKLSFSFGKDFDGIISKGGNLVSALNLILGFGTERASPKR